MLGGLRAETVGREVRFWGGIHLKFHIFPIGVKTNKYGSVAGIFINSEGNRCWPLDRDGTRLKPNPEHGPAFLGYVPAGPIGEYGWLLDMAQEAGLVLPESATHQETIP